MGCNQSGWVKSYLCGSTKAFEAVIMGRVAIKITDWRTITDGSLC